MGSCGGATRTRDWSGPMPRPRAVLAADISRLPTDGPDGKSWHPKRRPRSVYTSGRRRLSPAQVETHEAITLAGVVVITCRTSDDVAAFLATLGVPSRATAP